MTTVVLPGAVPASAAPAGVPSVPLRPVRFTGDPRAFWSLLIRGAIRMALTLGIYRFWLATDVRRFLWAHTEVNGESLEYTGTALELLIGFLIAIAILIPLNILFFVVALGMGTVGELASVLGFVVLAFLGQYAIYRARRYRLTRTVLRGVRFYQTGSAARYAVCGLFWWTLILLTLGLAYPFAQASLERFKMRHTHYGDLGGRFDGSGWSLFWRGVWMWLLVMAPLAIGFVLAIASVDWNAIVAAAAATDDPEQFFRQLGGATVGLYTALGVMITTIPLSILAAIILFPVFQALLLRWWASGLRFGELTVRSDLCTGPIYRAYLRFVGWALLLLIAASIVGALGYAVFKSVGAGLGAERGETAGTLLSLALYVVLMLGFSAVYQATVKLSLWRFGVESLEIEHLDVIERVKADGLAASPIGEGLADALNVGGF